MTIPNEMTAIEIIEPGGPDKLKATTLPVPNPAPGEVLIKVHTAGVNRPDVIQRQGSYPPPPGASPIPGLEISGTICALGDGVTALALGDEVMALVTGGGYAEYCTANADCCLPVPSGLSLTEAGAVPETYFTVWTNVFERGDLKQGGVFLVHGGTSGIGTTAIQMATNRGARVFATAGSDDKCKAAESLGAEACFNYHTEDFVERLKEVTDGNGADVILDMVGGDYVAKNIAAAAPDGRIVSIAFLQGSKVTANLMPVMLKRLTLTGSTLRARPVAQKKAIADALKANIWPLIEAGKIKPLIHASFPLKDAQAAHELMESSAHIGKIVLTA